MSRLTEEDSTSMDEVLKFLENEIKTFEEIFDELIGEHGFIFLRISHGLFSDKKGNKTSGRENLLLAEAPHPPQKPELKAKPILLKGREKPKTFPKPKLYPKPNLVNHKSEL